MDIVLRSVAVYIFIVFAIRLFGKKEIAQLSITDLVFVLLIANAVQTAMVGQNTTLVGGLVAAASLFIINYLFGVLLFKSRRISSFFQGHPLMLIYEGKEIEHNLQKARISHDELEQVVREHGVEKISDVNLAVLEMNGNISVLFKNFKHKSVEKRHTHKIVTKPE
ncbi:MAG: hypothetical protein A2868_01010 [Candidatus Levybacteria bacterium RIFCSPHIGHO2_01_FULL_40_15b]|nr:MAG: hypothetical protein A2868_01010 [Candidatus Levybacteria bacterium RIFCSPHIGHO2_01_FULL_40_15b]